MPLSSYHLLPEPSHSTLACTSLSILLQLDNKINRNAIHRFPFASYAAQYWIDHVRFRDMSLHVQDMVKHLFDLSQLHFAAWVWLYDVDHHWLDPMTEVHLMQPSAMPLYYASLCGLHGLVEHLVAARPKEINARGRFYDTALHAASAKGHFEIVQLLLNSDADPNLCDDDGEALLHSASQNGHVEVMKILLDRGVDMN
jgi:ankyrin repeat protein